MKHDTDSTLHIHDTRKGKLLKFEPTDPTRVGIYLCGLTVQGEPHLGHLRSGINFDVLRRWLEAIGYTVDFIRNITDIDDKILAASKQQNIHWYELASRMRRELDVAYAMLNVLPPTYEPTATGHIPEMVELIEKLIEKGHAYTALDGSGDVYFSVPSLPSYGEVSNHLVDETLHNVDSDSTRKASPHDFVLWKSSKGKNEPVTASWPSPWGRGRPGWHIECSAMAHKYLGESFDIHAGGLDLKFPHHENENAQAKGAGYDFTKYWMHNAWITASGTKMGKSLGNALSVKNVLESVRGIELRFYMISAHYRSHVEFSHTALQDAAMGFKRIENFLTRTIDVAGEIPLGALDSQFVDAMNNDLSTPAAVRVIHDMVRDGNTALQDNNVELAFNLASTVRAHLNVLGIDPYTSPWNTDTTKVSENDEVNFKTLVDTLITLREDARSSRDYTTSDLIRDKLALVGVSIEDTPHGVRWSKTSS